MENSDQNPSDGHAKTNNIERGKQQGNYRQNKIQPSDSTQNLPTGEERQLQIGDQVRLFSSNLNIQPQYKSRNLRSAPLKIRMPATTRQATGKASNVTPSGGSNQSSTNKGTKEKGKRGRKHKDEQLSNALALLKDRFKEFKDEEKLRAELSLYCDVTDYDYQFLRNKISRMNSKDKEAKRRREAKAKEKLEKKSAKPAMIDTTQNDVEEESGEAEQTELEQQEEEDVEVFTEYQVIQGMAERKIASYSGLSDVDSKFFKYLITATSTDGQINRKDENFIEYMKAAILNFEKTFLLTEQAEDSQMISFDEKCKIVISKQFTELIENKNLEMYYTKLEELVSSAMINEINVCTMVKDINIFDKLRNRGTLKLPPKASPKMALLLLRQNQIRTTFKESIEIVGRYDVSNATQQTVQAMLTEYYDLEQSVIKLILKHPAKLLWDNTIKNLIQIEYRECFASLIANCHDGSFDPAEKLLEIYNLVSPRIWIAKYIRNSTYTKDCTLQEMIYALQHCFKWSNNQTEESITKSKFKNLIAHSHSQVQTKTILTDDQTSKLDKFADEEAKRLDISTVYGVICKISQRFKENAKGFYEHRRVACLIAAQAVSSKKWATYVQVETGNGKTYIMLLACAYLQEEAGEDVVYVTRDEINLRQVENKCKLVGLKLMVTDYEELSLIVEAGKTFICDEYYAQLRESKMTIDEFQGLNPIFQMGIRFKAILTSAHVSNKFQMKLKKLFGPNGVEIQLHQSIQGKVGEQQEYQIQVECDGEDFMSKAIEAAKQRAKDQPIITFNITSDDFKAAQFDSQEGALVADCQTAKDVIKIQERAVEYERAIINMRQVHGVGTDLKFKKDALVIIANKGDIPDSELVKQLVSRGSRSMGTLKGVIYSDKEKAEQRWIESELSKFEGADFFDGPTIIRGILSYLEDKKDYTRYKFLAEVTKAEWMVSLSEFEKALPDKSRDAVMKHVKSPKLPDPQQKKKTKQTL